MARRNTVTRVAKWNAHMQQEALSPIMQRRLSAASVRYLASCDRSVEIEDAIKTIFNGVVGSGLPVSIRSCELPAYISFSRQYAALKDKFTGLTLTNEAAVVQALWVARGLNSGNLDALEGVL